MPPNNETPSIGSEATVFSGTFVQLTFLEFLDAALELPAADSDIVDPCGHHPVGTYLDDETNRERMARGVSLSGHGGDMCRESGCSIIPGTVADLMGAPTGNLRVLFRPGNQRSGRDGFEPAAETFEDAWLSGEGEMMLLPHAYALAELIHQGRLSTLEYLADAELDDITIDPDAGALIYPDLDPRLLGLAQLALQAWTMSASCPELRVDLTASHDTALTEIPRLQRERRREWSDIEFLALGIVELIPVTIPEIGDVGELLEGPGR